MRLIELARFRGGPWKRTTVDKATDVFAALLCRRQGDLAVTHIRDVVFAGNDRTADHAAANLHTAIAHRCPPDASLCRR